MPANLARQNALRDYIVFRIKAMEFLDILGLFNCLPANTTRQEELAAVKGQVPQGLVPLVSFLAFRPSQYSADSLKTVAVSWFALFIDKNGMDAIKLWSQVFPAHAGEVRAAWKKMESSWQILRTFRNSAGFHADKPMRFFGARHQLRKEWQKVQAALDEFKKLFDFFLKAEATELGAELGPALDSLLDELEKKDGTKFQREQFKAYLMIADPTALATVIVKHSNWREPGALPSPHDLRLPIGHTEPHARHAGMFLDPVRQGLRMRGNPELSVFRGANDQVRQGIQNVRMQARLRFVDGQERRRTRAQQRCTKTQKPHLPVGEFLRLQGPEQPGHFHLDAEERIHRFDQQSRAAKGLRDNLAKGLPIADFQNRLESRRKVRAVLAKNRRIHANLRLPQRGVQVCAEMMIKAPAQDLLAYCGYFRIEVRVNNL